MNNEILILSITAASIGFFHTLLGPDHYLPFIVMAKARKWTLGKTILITFLCGLGHILSSVFIGIIGIFFGIALMKLEALEAFRGNLAAWALIGFGFAYFIWGLRGAVKNKPHYHGHMHEADGKHLHKHTHFGRHSHVHDEGKKNITPWILFTIFVLGPCEPLIPILMYPAAKRSLSGLVLVTLVFGAVTIITMMTVVVSVFIGVKSATLGRFEKYSHALAGATICISGLAIQFLGL